MKVYFSGNYWGHDKYERAGKEIKVNKGFQWNGEVWRVPSVYLCRKGIVADICVRVEKEKIVDFLTKYQGREFSSNPSEREQIERDNPFRIDFVAEVKANGTTLGCDSWCSIIWNPVEVETEQGRFQINQEEAEEVMEYYKCDRAYGWLFFRGAFLWKGRKHPALSNLSLQLQGRPVWKSEIQFETEVGCEKKEIAFTCPVTDKKHSLKILSCEVQEMPENAWEFQDSMEYPKKYAVLTYRIEPELGAEICRIQDCSESDTPIMKIDRQANGAAGISIIGHADGPTSVFLAGKFPEKTDGAMACSALHFSAPEKVKWSMSFWKKEREDAEIFLS